jgi:hypothetical protein
MVIWLIGFLITNQLRDDKNESLFASIVLGILTLAAWPLILADWIKQKVG